MKLFTFCRFLLWLPMLAACSETEMGEYAKQSIGRSRQPIQLVVGDMAQLEVMPSLLSKGVNSNLQNDRLKPGTELGLFVITEHQYRDLLSMMTDSTLVPVQGLANNYEYLNVRAVVKEDGSIVVEDGALPNGLLYPADDSTRVALLAYAPYSPQYTLLTFILGIRTGVAADQCTDEAHLASDFVMGLPAKGNPFREVGPVEVNMEHIFTRVDLSIQLAARKELQSDYIEVNLEGVNTSCKLSLLALMNNPDLSIADNTEFVKGNVKMAELSGLSEDELNEGFPVSRNCCAVVIPDKTRQENLGTTLFSITLKGRADGRADTTIVRADMAGWNYYSGQYVPYVLRID